MAARRRGNWGGHRRRRRPQRLALVVALIQVIGTHYAAQHSQGPGRPLDWLGYALLVAGPVALTFRLRHRVGVLLVVTVVTLTYFALAYPYGPWLLSMFLAIAGAIIAGRRRPTWTSSWASGTCSTWASVFWSAPSVGTDRAAQPQRRGGGRHLAADHARRRRGDPQPHAAPSPRSPGPGPSGPHPRGAGAPAGQRGAAAHRPRAARRARPPHLADQRAGRRRRCT